MRRRVNTFLAQQSLALCYFHSMRALITVLVMAYFVSCANTGKVAHPAAEKATADPVRITQFYATRPAIPRGEDLLLCYGVENAAAVRITPPVEQIRPALSRCFTITPDQTTTFTLIAEDSKAKTTSQSVTVKVTPPLPHFTDLSISSKEVASGELVTFCFKATNAVAVRGGPGNFRLGGSTDNNCLLDHPTKTTSYRIVIEGAGGQTDDAKITVNVR
jgi:hypothetical protein